MLHLGGLEDVHTSTSLFAPHHFIIPRQVHVPANCTNVKMYTIHVKYHQLLVYVMMRLKSGFETDKIKPQAIKSDPAHAHGAGIVPAAENLLHLVGGINIY